MLQSLKENDHVILLYKRYIDDIFAVIENKKNRGLHTRVKLEEGLNSLDPKGKSIKVRANRLA